MGDFLRLVKPVPALLNEETSDAGLADRRQRRPASPKAPPRRPP